MTVMDEREMQLNVVGLADEYRLEALDGMSHGDSEERGSLAYLPWIGALPNPCLGPMLVVNDGGYLVPLCTAVDLLRGCRSFWQRGWG